jgi:3'-5' exoribonuclease
MAGGTMVRELEPGSLVEATFAVTRKVRRSRKDGRAYLDIELADRSGRVRARVWEAVELLDGRFGTGDTVRVLGRVGSYEGKLELELRDVERLPDGDPLELVPGARRDVDDLDGYLDFLIAEIHDDALRGVVEGILSDATFRARFRAAAATESGHHAYAGGLIEHTVSVTALCRETAQWQPGLDTDVLTAAALVHDCGTPDALADGPVIQPSAEGLALGHVHTGLRRIEAAAARTRLPQERLLALLACVAAHHGPPEGRRFPSPEAVALHAANALDARVAEARSAQRFESKKG